MCILLIIKVFHGGRMDLEGVLPVFLRKPIATCDFPVGSGPPALSCPHWMRAWPISQVIQNTVDSCLIKVHETIMT